MLAVDGEVHEMRGCRRTELLATLAVGALAAAGFARYRRWHLRWGATDDELAETLPGDELITGAAFVATRAITIDAQPRDVWPWLVQLGFGRAGWYSYDLLDNLGKPSADEVVPELQELRVGDAVPMGPKVTPETAYVVRELVPERWMLWEKPSSTWGWRLESLPDDRTRLVVRIRVRYQWRRPIVIAELILLEVGDFPMMRRELLGIRRRAEALRTDRSAGRQEEGADDANDDTVRTDDTAQAR